MQHNPAHNPHFNAASCRQVANAMISWLTFLSKIPKYATWNGNITLSGVQVIAQTLRNQGFANYTADVVRQRMEDTVQQIALINDPNEIVSICLHMGLDNWNVAELTDVIHGTSAYVPVFLHLASLAFRRPVHIFRIPSGPETFSFPAFDDIDHQDEPFELVLIANVNHLIPTAPGSLFDPQADQLKAKPYGWAKALPLFAKIMNNAQLLPLLQECLDYFLRSGESLEDKDMLHLLGQLLSSMKSAPVLLELLEALKSRIVRDSFKVQSGNKSLYQVHYMKPSSLLSLVEETALDGTTQRTHLMHRRSETRPCPHCDSGKLLISFPVESFDGVVDLTSPEFAAAIERRSNWTKPYDVIQLLIEPQSPHHPTCPLWGAGARLEVLFLQLFPRLIQAYAETPLTELPWTPMSPLQVPPGDELYVAGHLDVDMNDGVQQQLNPDPAVQQGVMHLNVDIMEGQAEAHHQPPIPAQQPLDVDMGFGAGFAPHAVYQPPEMEHDRLDDDILMMEADEAFQELLAN